MDTSEPSDMHQIAPDWRWADKIIYEDKSNQIQIWSIVSTKRKKWKATMKVFRADADGILQWRARQELMALEQVKGEIILINYQLF